MFNSLPSSAKSSKAVLASRVGNLFRTTPLSTQDIFKPVELAALETNLKDDFIRHPWLHKLISTVLDECSTISLHQRDSYHKALEMGKLDCKAVKDKRHFLQRKLVLLEKQQRSSGRQVTTVPTPLVPPSTVCIAVELEEVCSFLLNLDHESNMNIQSSESIEEIQEMFSNLCFSSNLDIDNHVSELAILDSDDNPQAIGEAESQQLRRKYSQAYDQLRRLHACLWETKLYFESEDRLWLTELNRLFDECKRSHQQKIVVHLENCNNPLTSSNKSMSMATKLINLRVPRAAVDKDELDVLHDSVKAIMEQVSHRTNPMKK